MRFNKKTKLKTKAKTLILILLITLSMAPVININGNLPQANREDEKLNASSPIDPIFRYNYENDFDYYWHTAYLEGFFPVNFVEGYNTEWSQDPNDNNILKLIFGCTFPLATNIAGNLYVVSKNEFEKTLNPNLGAYIDWKITLGIYHMFGAGINSITLSLLIYTSPEDFEVIFYHVSLTDLSTQEGQLYLPNFDQYIWNDGKVRFVLGAAIIGSSPAVGDIVMSLNFEGLRIVQELQPHEPEAKKRTLILVHGWSLWGDPTPDSFWNMFAQYDRYLRFYDGNIHIIHYYGMFMGENCSIRTPIERVAQLLALYITTHFETITDSVDFICHSMGGLVVRYMIKHYYETIKSFYAEVLGRDFNIINVCTIATPNHGVWYGWAGVFNLNVQGLEMMAGSPFLIALNFPPETPYSNYINWFTYAGGKFIITDGIVEIISVPLIGATNRGLYPLDHSEMIQVFCVNVVVFNDIYKPPLLIQSIFFQNIPGKYILIKDLIVEPDPDTPGEILLTITLPTEDVISIYPTTVTIQVSGNNYLMTLKEGTTDTFEVKLPLGEGYYSFIISAQERDGGLYRIWGNLKIPDDDVKPPEIQITPEDLSISDEEAVGGVLISWEISDYSGISEAIVSLNGIEIASYGKTEDTITDSCVLPNVLGEYTISIWARDNDDDPEHDPPGEDWSECTIEKTFIIYDDD
ncbi:MAG: esterase/lipase family protein, partial [Promethearchaeota archaeon]